MVEHLSLRDLAWSTGEIAEKSTVSYQLGRWAENLAYEDLPPEVIHQTKRILLDSFACALGAYGSLGSDVVERAIADIGGREEATVIGSGTRTSASNATLANSFLVRMLDYNDLGGGGHGSDAIGALLAVAEVEQASPKELMVAIVISYEIGSRVVEAMAGNSQARALEELAPLLMNAGWTLDTRAGLNMPAAVGRLMNLDAMQIAHAIGNTCAHSPSLGILDGDREEYSMSRNLRFGSVAQHAVLSCQLVRAGYTGFLRVVEGDHGFAEIICNGTFAAHRLCDFSGWRIITNSAFKTVCQNYTTHGNVLSTLKIVREHDIHPGDVVSVRITTNGHDSRHTTVMPGKKYPRNIESASHSAYFANAMAIKERNLGPAQMRPEKFVDPVVLELIEKITIEVDPAFQGVAFGGGCEIVTTDGRRLTARVDPPHGHWDDPLTDQEVEAKFEDAAAMWLSDGRIRQVIDAVWNLESLENVGDLMQLLVADKSAAT